MNRATYEAIRAEIWFLACHYRRMGCYGAADHLRGYFYRFSNYAVIS